jgi:hypothetical protein
MMMMMTLCATTLRSPFYIHVFPREWVQGVRRDPDSGMQCTVISVVNKGMLNSTVNTYVIEFFFFKGKLRHQR